MNSDDASSILQAAKQLLIAKPRERVERVHTGGGSRHTNKKMLTVSCIPQQVGERRQELAEAGFADITIKDDGTVIAHSRKAQQEYAYFRTGRINSDGGYFETIKEGRMRELERLRKPC